jgi:hypothetical protein
MRQARHVISVVEGRDAYRSVVGKLVGRGRLEDLIIDGNIKIK